MVLKYLSLVLFASFTLVSCSDDAGKSGVTEIEEGEQEEPMAVEEARTVYTVNCASCHGIDGKLKASNSADLSISKMPDDEILKTINKGNDKGMMPYQDILSQREREGLVKFVRSLRE